MANYILAGGTGFVGKHLSQLLLAQKHEVYILTTQKNKQTDGQINYIYWNPLNNYIDEQFTCKLATVINLAGAGVAEKRWTQARKKLIIESRTNSLNTLLNATKQGQIETKKIVSASAIGYYGSGTKTWTELDNGDESYLSTTCKQWEAAALQFESLQIPTAITRIGIVLGKESGALKEFIKPLHFGVAGIPSTGKQIYSWIDVEDLCQVLYFLSNTQHVGIYNAVASNPCSINDIFFELKKYYKVIINAHAPDWALKILLGEMSTEVLKSATVSNKKIKEAGFAFKYDNIEKCIQHLMK